MTGRILALTEAAAIFVIGCATVVSPGWTTRAEATALASAALLALVCVTAFYYTDLYDVHSVPSLGRFAARLPRALVPVAALLVAAHLLLPQRELLPGRLAGTLVASLPVLVALRALSYRLLRAPAFIERVLIVGATAAARALIAEIEARPNCGYVVVGVADDGTPADAATGRYPTLGPLAHLSRIMDQVRPDRLVVALAERRDRLPIAQLVEWRVVAGVVIEDAADALERLTGKLPLEILSPRSVVFSRDFFKPRLEHAVARAVSLAVAAVALVVLVPVFGLIALAIKLDSPGPVFFVHDRVGLRGRPFRLIKFRTMHPAIAATSEWVRDNQARITRVGAWLRRFRLDELPQFVNALRGDLNLVGPRPHPVSNFPLFMQHIPHYWLRFAVRPGITGWAQIRYGYANDLAEEIEKARYDLYYVKHMSLAFDLRILLDTVKTCCLGRGAAAVAVAAPAGAIAAPRPTRADVGRAA